MIQLLHNPPLQSTNQSEQMQHTPQLPPIQPRPALAFEQPQTLQYQHPPTMAPISMESPMPPATFDQTLEYAHREPPTLKFPMEYQQSSTPAMTFNQPPALQYHLPATTAPISMDYQQSAMPAMTFDQPLALNYQPTPLQPTSMEYHQAPIPAIEMNQCHECDDTTSSQKALPPPRNAPALPAPTTYPALTGPQSTALVLPNQEATATSLSTLPPAPPTRPEAPTQPTPKNVAKYQGYISTKPSTTPDMITYICTRCNTHFKKKAVYSDTIKGFILNLTKL